MNAAGLLTVLLIALLKTNGEGGTFEHPYHDAQECTAAGERLEAQFEALTLEDSDGNEIEGHPKVVWTCFDPNF